MPLVVCRNCGAEGHVAWNCSKPKAVPEAPRSNVRSPSRRSRDIEKTPQHPSPATAGFPAAEESPTDAPDKPDTAPSDLSAMSDDELRLYYNEWMRRKMRKRRAGE